MQIKLLFANEVIIICKIERMREAKKASRPKMLRKYTPNPI